MSLIPDIQRIDITNTVHNVAETRSRALCLFQLIQSTLLLCDARETSPIEIMQHHSWAIEAGVCEGESRCCDLERVHYTNCVQLG